MTAPWRLLVLDPEPDDPKWVLATVTLPADVRPAVMTGTGGDTRYEGWAETARWVSESVGRQVRLVPLTATVWRVDEQPARGEPEQADEEEGTCPGTR